MNGFEIVRNCSAFVDGNEKHYKAGETVIPFGAEIRALNELVEYGLAKVYTPSQKNKVTKVVRPSKTK